MQFILSRLALVEVVAVQFSAVVVELEAVPVVELGELEMRVQAVVLQQLLETE
jgi:hypothetical protein